jgi:hypothetical protein
MSGRRWRIRLPKNEFLKLLLFLGLLLVCIVAAVGGVDVACSIDIAQRLPIYPNAELVDMEYTAFRPRAGGITRMWLLSPDDHQTVRAWYLKERQELLRRNSGAGIATVRRVIEENPDGPGTTIYLASACGWE